MDHILTLIRDRKIDEAQIQLEQIGQNQSPEWQFARGCLFEVQGEVEQAIDCFETVIDMDGEHVEAAFRLAFNLDLRGNEDQAIQMYEVLANRTPAHVSALLNLAVIYEDREEYGKALNCVNRILSDHPLHTRALLFKKDILSSMNMHYDENIERSQEKRDAVLDTPVSDFELSVRSRNCLKKMNIHSLGDLLKITESELLAYKNFGETSLNEIKAMLKQKGLRLGQLKEESQVTTRPAPVQSQAVTQQDTTLSKYLSELELSGRSRKCLQRLNLMTVSELVSKTEAELLATKNFGQTSLNEIKQKLAELGLSLRKSH